MPKRMTMPCPECGRTGYLSNAGRGERNRRWWSCGAGHRWTTTDTVIEVVGAGVVTVTAVVRIGGDAVDAGTDLATVVRKCVNNLDAPCPWIGYDAVAHLPSDTTIVGSRIAGGERVVVQPQPGCSARVASSGEHGEPVVVVVA